MGNAERDVRARSRAEALFGKERAKDDEVIQARDRERQQEAEKTAHLRALRLAKEKSEADANAAASRRKPTR
ncbi:MAG: hypothetical protein KGJ66_02865 [Alphaproteobacteria bacterium]|nr:hypothetical protein [Alphaproteobacteria bacterium]